MVEVTIHRLTTDDIADCLSLAQDRDWLAEKSKWRLLFQAGEVFGARDDDGALVGTAALTRHHDSLSVIGMVIVAKRWGGQGLGRRLMVRALSEVNDETVILCSTDQGLPLYNKLGFVVAGSLGTYTANSRIGHRTHGSRSATAADYSAILAIDAEAVGASREELIGPLLAMARDTRVVTSDGVVVGYGAAWQNNEQLVIGPIIASDIAAAEILLHDLAQGGVGSIRVDIGEHQPELRRWAERYGFVAQNSAVVMVRGSSSLPGDRGRWFSPIMQALC